MKTKKTATLMACMQQLYAHPGFGNSAIFQKTPLPRQRTVANVGYAVRQVCNCPKGWLRGTASNNFYLWYPSPDPLPLGEGFLDIPFPIALSPDSPQRLFFDFG